MIALCIASPSCWSHNATAMTPRPVRIQCRRTKGFRLQAASPNGLPVVYVGRPSKWGNPFALNDWRASFRAVTLGCRGDRAGMQEAAVKLYRLWLTTGWRTIKKDNRTFWDREIMTVKAPIKPSLDEIKTELRGKNLACWCHLDRPCHADVLLELANA